MITHDKPGSYFNFEDQSGVIEHVRLDGRKFFSPPVFSRKQARDYLADALRLKYMPETESNKLAEAIDKSALPDDMTPEGLRAREEEYISRIRQR